MTYLILFLAVIIGALIGEYASIKESYKKLFLSFSGAFLLAVTVFHLLPEAYESYSGNTAIFIMLGVFIQILLEFVSKGIEHAHSPKHHHHHEHQHSHELSSGHFHGITIAMFISLCIHSFIEGAPINSHNHLHDHIHDHGFLSELKNPVLLGVFIHKIPIASILYLSFRSSKYSIAKSLLMLFIFALMTPLGAYLSSNIEFFVEYSKYINAIVIGIFLHISTTILFESSSDHKFNMAKLMVVFFATLLVYLTY